MKLFLTVGNIGTGKSTTANKLIDDANRLDDRNTILVSNDNLTTTLFNGYHGPDVWTDRHIHLYSTVKRHIVREALAHCFNIIVDGTHMGKINRKVYIDIAKEFDADVTVYLHTYPDGLQRRINNPKSEDHSVEVWTQIHEMFEKAYEEPTLSEGINDIIKVN